MQVPPMNSPTRTSSLLTLLAFCFLAVLATPHSGYGQRTSSEFKPFKFELGERMSPSDEKELRDDIPAITAVQRELAEQDPWSVKCWNDAYPGYRWHQLLMEASRNHLAPNPALKAGYIPYG